MKIIGKTVEFRSENTFFHKEYKGLKPNTERILSEEEVEKVRLCKNIIIRPRQNPRFWKPIEKKITDISVVGELLGKYLVVISWKHEGD